MNNDTRNAVAQGHRIAKNADRVENDDYPTPPCAVRALLEVERFRGGILEPASGEGYISRTLEAEGYKVYSSDISPNGYGTGNMDFFCLRRRLRAKHVITNPPYRFAREFIEHSLDIVSGKVAMLLQMRFFGSVGRYQWFKDTNLSRVRVFSRTLPYRDGDGQWHKSGGMLHAWFIWDRESTPNPDGSISLFHMPPGEIHTPECWELGNQS